MATSPYNRSSAPAPSSDVIAAIGVALLSNTGLLPTGPLDISVAAPGLLQRDVEIQSGCFTQPDWIEYGKAIGRLPR